MSYKENNYQNSITSAVKLKRHPIIFEMIKWLISAWHFQSNYTYIMVSKCIKNLINSELVCDIATWSVQAVSRVQRIY